eukprot:CAMPEP_0202367590 /NCGR_PEP_ID=MMETSP1126-20121109/17737_1 /ASSEMBLY_ACC=CAM_ASM_000457 /TAXON_ID=3047 /ORGANISM="Dunaliella tertiolecta, Strain CCMP1320" /LENGTH=64 /DNA_ID=CAMNT_0048962863 /DNA_START=2330 /DNA_END=2521 /DNA_ORIENTATION=-
MGVPQQGVIHNLGFQVLVDVAALQGLEGKQLFGCLIMDEAHRPKGPSAQRLDVQEPLLVLPKGG